MSLLNSINSEIISCYKSGQNEKRVFLQTIKSVLLNYAKEKRRDLNEQEEVSVLKSEEKKLKEATLQYEAGGRADLVEKTKCEISFLADYLPNEASDGEIEEVVSHVISESADKSFGNIMKQAMAKLQGRTDGSRVAQKVKEQIQG